MLFVEMSARATLPTVAPEMFHTSGRVPSGANRVAALSKARLAMSRATGDELPPDGQNDSPEFFPQGRGNLRYVVVQGEGSVTPHLCLIAQSYDGRRVRRLWKLPTRRARHGERPEPGTLAKALFSQGFVPARKPNRTEAKALSHVGGLAGYFISIPGSGIYSWFVGSTGKVYDKHRQELPVGEPIVMSYPITPEERTALRW